MNWKKSVQCKGVCKMGDGIIANIFNLDTKTLIAVLAGGNLTCAILQYTYQFYSTDKKRNKNDYYFMRAKIVHFFAFCLIYMRDVIPDILSVNLGNTFVLLGFYLEAMSVLKSLMNNTHKNIILSVRIIFGSSVLLFNLTETFYQQTALRITTASICIFAILIIPSSKLVLTKELGKFKRIIGVYYVFFLIFLLPRSMFFITDRETSIMSNNMIQTLTFYSLTLLLIFSICATMLLRKEETDNLISLMATTDSLTGVTNRHGFFNDVANIFNRHKSLQIPITILFFDIDHFKKVNDLYGHIFGDDVLKFFAKTIQQNMRAGDLLCRYGGEEFLGVIQDADYSVSQRVAKRIMEQIEKAAFETYPDFKFTTSIGIAIGIPKEDDMVETFIEHADQALYEAKRTGRNKITMYEVNS